MYGSLRVAVVIPAHDEAEFIVPTVCRVPSFVDLIVVVDDGSTDGTAEAVLALARADLHLLRHQVNRGVGGAIVSGYQEALRRGADVLVVMGGDGQMDEADLPALLEPLVAGRADYAKGNRLVHPHLLGTMPAIRLFGNIGLSLMTRLAVGLPGLWDSQCGYTAITRRAALAIDLPSLYPRFGFPNDLLGHLARQGFLIEDVMVRPIYGKERSEIRLPQVGITISLILLRAWIRRFQDRLWDPMAPQKGRAGQIIFLREQRLNRAGSAGEEETSLRACGS